MIDSYYKSTPVGTVVTFPTRDNNALNRLTLYSEYSENISVTIKNQMKLITTLQLKRLRKIDLQFEPPVAIEPNSQISLTFDTPTSSVSYIAAQIEYSQNARATECYLLKQCTSCTLQEQEEAKWVLIQHELACNLNTNCGVIAIRDIPESQFNYGAKIFPLNPFIRTFSTDSDSNMILYIVEHEDPQEIYKLQAQLGKGCRILSHQFSSFGTWTIPAEISEWIGFFSDLNDSYSTTYIYNSQSTFSYSISGTVITLDGAIYSPKYPYYQSLRHYIPNGGITFTVITEVETNLSIFLIDLFETPSPYPVFNSFPFPHKVYSDQPLLLPVGVSELLLKGNSEVQFWVDPLGYDTPLHVKSAHHSMDLPLPKGFYVMPVTFPAFLGDTIILSTDDGAKTNGNYVVTRTLEPQATFSRVLNFVDPSHELIELTEGEQAKLMIVFEINMEPFELNDGLEQPFHFSPCSPLDHTFYISGTGLITIFITQEGKTQ